MSDGEPLGPGPDYSDESLRESDLEPDPFKQFAKWYQELQSRGWKTHLFHLLRFFFPDLFVPAQAMILATAGKDGKPSARVVLLKQFDEQGLVFYTNYDSPKSRELAENPHAALVFYWPALGRQVRITGTVNKISRTESEHYFRTRPWGSQISAWISEQSAVVSNRMILEDRFKALAKKYKNQPIPLPPYWGGLRLAPASFEFWQGRPDRLHDRLRYRRRPNGGWLIERLAP